MIKMIICITLTMALTRLAAAEFSEPSAQADLTELSIAQLLNVEVYSTSKFVQKTTSASAAVTIITAADIKSYGYRTLADILASARGLLVTYQGGIKNQPQQLIFSSSFSEFHIVQEFAHVY